MHPSNTDSFASILLIVGVGKIIMKLEKYLPFALILFLLAGAVPQFCRPEHDRGVAGAGC